MFRLFYIFGILIKYSLLFILIKLNLNQTPKHTLLHKFFEDASGSFIKFGQLLAMRVDVLPKEYSLELMELLDNVKPFSYSEVKEIFVEELGDLPEKIFKDFQKKPFASASFAQVHGAKLEDGTIVVVKILRPGIEEKVNVDFMIVRFIAFLADIFYRIEALPWKEFASEFERWTKQELDYHIEAENTERMRLISLESRHIVIPKVYFQLSTKRILVEEYMEGIHLARVMRGLTNGSLDAKKLLSYGVDIKKTPRVLISEILKHYFIHGAFNADPHPGNFILLKNGKIAMIDFGIIGQTLPGKHSSFVKSLQYDVQNKFKEASFYFADFVGDNLKQLIASAFPTYVDQKHVDEFMRMLTDHFSEQVIHLYYGSESDLINLKKDVSTLIIQVLKASNIYKIKVPKEVVMFIRAFSIFVLTAKQLDKNFEIGTEMKRFFDEYGDKIPLQEDKAPVLYQRINRERAIEKLNTWLAYLVEKDPAVFELVNNYIKRYNIIEK